MLALGALLVGLSIGGLFGLYKVELEKNSAKGFITVPSQSEPERKYATVPGATRRNLK